MVNISGRVLQLQHQQPKNNPPKQQVGHPNQASSLMPSYQMTRPLRTWSTTICRPTYLAYGLRGRHQELVY